MEGWVDGCSCDIVVEVGGFDLEGLLGILFGQNMEWGWSFQIQVWIEMVWETGSNNCSKSCNGFWLIVEKKVCI